MITRYLGKIPSVQLRRKVRAVLSARTIIPKDRASIFEHCLLSWNSYSVFPIYAVIGLTDRCNLKCGMCPRQDKTLTLGEMPLHNFKRIIDQLNHVVEVNPTGLGEPLLYPHLYDALEYVNHKHIKVRLTTNATLLTRERTIDLLGIGLSQIEFSVDGATQGMYEKIRVNAKFDSVCRNIKGFVDTRNRLGYGTRCLMRVVVMNENLAQVPLFVGLAKRLGIDILVYQDLQYLFNVGLSVTEQSVRVNPSKQVTSIFNKTMWLSRQYNMPIYGLEYSTKRLGFRNVWACTDPYETLVINPVGRVRICCGIHHKTVGNAFIEPIGKIWNNAEFRQWRNRMASGTPPLECLQCSSF